MPDAERWGGSPLDGDTDVDVAIVGGGYTGLWTAWHLLQYDPSLRVLVIERDAIGHGASGRNGGWCSALLPMSHDRMIGRHGVAATARLQRAMYDNVADVEAFVRRFAPPDTAPAIFHRGGTIDLARSAPQEARLRAHVAELHELGASEDDIRWVDRDEAVGACAATRVLGAAFTPHCGAVHPMRLVHLLARTVADAGARIVEGTEAVAIEDRIVRTRHGDVRADVVVRATEGYTCALPGERRSTLPIYSLMIGTEPLDDATWAAIGLDDRPTFNDGRHLVIYGQRTADGRLAFGGRGAPYHFGSAIRPEFDTDDRVRSMLTDTLRDLFPVLADVEVTHHWGGVLAAPRDWTCTVRFDRRSGRAVAGGYVGDGVGTAHLAGRTLAALVTGADDDVTRLAWVGHRSRAWEPEPLRWIGVNLARSATARADRAEERTGREARLWGAVMSTLLRR